MDEEFLTDCIDSFRINNKVKEFSYKLVLDVIEYCKVVFCTGSFPVGKSWN